MRYIMMSLVVVYRRGVTWTNFERVKKGKTFEIFWRTSMHYLIHAYLEKSGILPNYALGIV